MNGLYIDVGYACYGVFYDETKRIVLAPPIARWMIGKYIEQVIPWLNRKNATIINI